MNVEDLVQERIAAARRKIANDKKRRAELAEARKHGIAARHRQKLAHLQKQATTTPPDQSAPRRARGTGHGPISLSHTRGRQR